jgi:hypothetical protein
VIAPDPGWRAPERWVWQRVLAGQPADFNAHAPPTRDAARPADWPAGDDGRTVRAITIAAMLTRPPWCDALPVTGLKLLGGRIPGGLDLRHLRLARPLWLEGCRIEGEVVLEDAQIAGQLSFDGSWIGGTANLKCGRFGFVSCVGTRFSGDLLARMARVDYEFAAAGVRVRGDMLIGEMTIGSELHLEGARITGRLNLDLTQAKLLVLGMPGRPAVVGRGISMNGASFASDLQLGPLGVALPRDDPQEAAILAQGLSVQGWLVIEGVSARQRLDFSFSRFGNVDFNRTPSLLGAVDMFGMAVAGNFLLRQGGRWRPGAMLNLRSARLGALQDEMLQAWPQKLQLHGFDPGRLGAFGSTTATSYMDRPAAWFLALLARTAETAQQQPMLWRQLPRWLRRIWPVPGSAPHWLRPYLAPGERNIGYRASTYATFAQRLRDLGRVGPADLIAYESREIDRRNAIFPRRQALWLLRATMGYGIGAGYFRALYWVGGLAAVCLATAALDASLFGWHRSVFAKHSLIWVIYACIGHVLPIVSLDKAYGDALPGQIAGGVGKLVFHLVTLCGWLLGGMLAAGLSGLTQRPK